MAPPSTEYILLDLLCPSLGVMLATLTFAAPVTSLRSRLSKGSLGDLNPTPWAVMTGNCAGWIAYSYLTKDLFVLFANVPGLMVSIWLNFGAIKLQYRTAYMDMHMHYCEQQQTRSRSRLLRRQQRRLVGNTSTASSDGRALPSQPMANDGHDPNNDHEYMYDVEEEIEPAVIPSTVPHERKVLWVLLVWLVVGSAVAHVQPLTNYQREQIIGYVVNLNLCFFYFAPLTTMVEVCRTRCSASIHRPTTLMTCLNSFFWLAYGLAVTDPFIYVPNGVGLGFGLVQALLLCLYSSKGRAGGRGARAGGSGGQQDDARETLIPEGDGGDVDVHHVDGGDDSTGADRFDNDGGMGGGLV